MYYVFAPNNVDLQDGGGCDQDPVSVHMMLASPSRACAPLHVNCTRLPTAYLPPSMPAASDCIRLPFSGIAGGGHCIARTNKNVATLLSVYRTLSVFLYCEIQNEK